MAINYERVNWDTTKYVNPENMNQMDEGIESACNGVDNLNASVDERIGDMSTLPQPNVDLSSNITAINSKLEWENKTASDVNSVVTSYSYIENDYNVEFSFQTNGSLTDNTLLCKLGACKSLRAICQMFDYGNAKPVQGSVWVDGAGNVKYYGASVSGNFCGFIRYAKK